MEKHVATHVVMRTNVSVQDGYLKVCRQSESQSFILPPQVREVVQPPMPAHSSVVARPVRKAPPTTIQDMRIFPEIIPVQEVILEETAEEESSAPPSEEKGWIPDAH